MGEGPGGGIYKHNTSGEWVYGDTSLGSSLPSALYEYLYIAGGGSSSTQTPAKAPGERYLEFGSQGPGTYQVDANGFEIPGGGFKPKTTSSGGGGASHTYETRVDSDGSKTGIPGATYQIDLLDGSVSILSKPSTTSGTNPADQNNDGLDDSTNLAMGVYAFKGSPTGYAYGAGQPVWPNGAPYEGGSGGSGAPDLVNGKYVWNGTKFVVAPGLETPTSTNYGSLGGGTPSRALSATEQASLDKLSTANNIAQIKAQEAARRETDRAAEAAKAAAVEDAQAWQSEESAKNRAQQESQFQATYGLSVQKFIADEQQRTEDRRLAAVDAFGKGLTSYDAKAYFDALDEAGYDINNLVRGGANLLTDEALTPSAAALGIIRGNPAASAGLPSVPGGPPASGLPGPASVPGSPSVASSGLGGSVAGQSDRVTRKYGDIRAQRAASEAKGVDRYIRQITTEANRALGAIPQAPDPNVVGRFNFGPGPSNYQWGVNRNIERGAAQSMYPGYGNYVPVSMARQSGAGLGPAQTAGMGRDIFTDSQVQPRAVLPGLANGGLAPVGQPAIVGERGVPEMIIPTPQGTIVRPMEPGQAQAMMRMGAPGYADGTDLVPDYSAWNTTRATRPRTYETTAQPVATTPTVQQAPVAQTGLQAPQPAYQPQQPAPTSGLPTAPYPAQPIPVAASGLPATVTASGVGPQPDQTLLDEVRRQREATLLMNGPSPYNLKWGGMSDLYRKTYAENQAQRYGIPAEEILWQGSPQQARRGLGGVAFSGLGRLGY